MDLDAEGKSCTLECCEENCDGCGFWKECSACARKECALYKQHIAKLETELEDYPFGDLEDNEQKNIELNPLQLDINLIKTR